MSIGAKEAAELVGISKAGILKAIKTGKLSATKDINGVWTIDTSELFRVYQPINVTPSTPPPTSEQQAIDGLQRENELLRQTIEDLRRRLDAESEERRRLSLILTESPQPPKSKGWLARLMGG